MSQTYNIQKRNYTNQISLNHLEVFYLRLHAHGMNSDTICDFLNLEKLKINRLRFTIYSKFKTKNWCQIIALALEQGHLNKSDYVDDLVKQIALKQVSHLLQIDKPAAMQKAVFKFYLSTKKTFFKPTTTKLKQTN
ncbi:hypothetical protein ACFSQP_12575 [Bizionia sediminis]|uniref:Uncharacterized protein n=1 Tax=Bizionia sediminis TaxID=1737064 RepID=A0ABW5KWH5_9FLAO